MINSLNIDKTNWIPTKLGEIVFEPKESTKDAKAEGLEHIVGLEHIDSGDLHLRNSEPIESSTTFTKKFDEGDVLFGRRRAYLKKAAKASFSGICSGDITVLRAKGGLFPSLLPFIIHNDKFFDWAITHSAGGLSPRVKFKDLANYELLLPPKEEQPRLAELLWAMDEVIEKEYLCLNKLRQAYVVKIEKDLIDHDSDKIYFNDFGKIIRGVGYKPDNLLDKYNESACIILRSNNISKNRINYDEVKFLPKDLIKDEQILQDGDFAICMSNGSKDLVGKSAIYRSNDMNVSFGSFCAAMRPKDIFSKELLTHLFASKSYRYFIKRILTGSTINNLKPSDIEGLSMRVDMKNAEKNILKLNSLRKGIKELKNKLSISKSLQKSLINQIF